MSATAPNNCNRFYFPVEPVLVILGLFFLMVGCRDDSGQSLNSPQWMAAPKLSEAAFVRAVIEGETNNIQLGLDQNINPNAKNRYGDTALIWAVYRDQQALAQTLLQRGANPNISGTYNKAAMHWAAESGLVHQMDLLLKNQAKIDIYDDHFQTPLHFAVKKGRDAAVRFLLKNGADTNWVDEKGESPLYLAVEGNWRDIAELLVLAGGDPHKKATNGKTPLSLAIQKDRQGFFQTKSIAQKDGELARKIEAKIVTVEENADTRPKLDRHRFTRALHHAANTARKASGLSELVYHEGLAKLATAHSRDMINRNFFEHVNPSDENPLHRAQRMGFEPPPYADGERIGFGIGENIYQSAVHSGMTSQTRSGKRFLRYEWLSGQALAKQVVAGWMASPGHRDNILNREFTHQGFGFAVKGTRVWVTQNFYFPTGLKEIVDGRDRRPSYRATRIARMVHDSINLLRAKHQRLPMTWDDSLAEIAEDHGRDMEKRAFFDHVNPDGIDASVRAKNKGYRLSGKNMSGDLKIGVGENLSLGRVFDGGATSTVGDTRFLDYNWLTEEALVARAIEEWWASPGHRANMLNKDYDRSGVAVIIDEKDRIYFIHNFF